MIDVSDGQDALKRRYHKGLVRVLLDDDELAPGYADIARKEIGSIGQAFGSKFCIVLKVGDPETDSTDLGVAETKAAATTEGGHSRYVEMQITPTMRYSAVGVSGKAWNRSLKDMNSFVKHNGEELDSGMRSMHRALVRTIAGNGTGVLATVASRPSATTFTVTNRSDMWKFRKGMELEASATNSGGVLKAGGAVRVSGINPDTKLITIVGADVSANWANADKVFSKGDYSTTTTLKRWLGYDFWVPTTLPAVGSGADASGVERSSIELAGHRFDCTSSTNIMTSLLDAAAQFSADGIGSPDRILINPITYNRLVIVLNATKQGTTDGGSAKGKVAANVGYNYITLACALGNLPVIPDRTVPLNTAYFQKTATWILAYSGPEAVKPVDGDGLVYRKVTGQSEVRYVASFESEAQVICLEPGRNGVAFNIT